MKAVIGIKMKLAFLFIIFIFVIIILAIFINTKKEDVIVNTEGVATINNPVISPSGKYQMKIVDESSPDVKKVKIVIYNIRNGEVESTPIFSSNDLFRTRDTLFFIWGDDDKVWVYSGDVGTFFWTCVSDNNWEKHIYAENKTIKWGNG
jgi:hypothetical protein